MKKLNKKGFALVETLVVTVFVTVLFGVIYTNMFPLMAEYEKREAYDDLEGKYAAYWVKSLILEYSYWNKYQELRPSLSTTKYFKSINCNDITEIDPTKLSVLSVDDQVKHSADLSRSKAQCEEIWKKYSIKNVYLTEYNISNFKTNNGITSETLQDYLQHIPNYTNSDNNEKGINYRIIVEMERKGDSPVEGEGSHTNESEKYFAYSNIELRLRGD